MTPVALSEVDTILARHAGVLGDEATLYRNHAQRVANLTLAWTGGREREKIAVAAAFHDLGIWTDRTFDYLGPSVRLAEAHLAAADQSDWTGEITAMILNHHKIGRHRDGGLVEAFRRADWADVSRGLLAAGPMRAAVPGLYARFPDVGFHAKLAQLAFARLRSHPLSPLPMLRL